MWVHVILLFNLGTESEKIKIQDYQTGVMTVNLLQKLQGAILQNENKSIQAQTLFSPFRAYDHRKGYI